MNKSALRELILSDYDAELGLILNERFKLFPQTARFYRKYKKYKFWQLSRHKSVKVSEPRYYGLSAVLNAELHTFKCSYWLDYTEVFYTTPWLNWQNRITIGMTANKSWTIRKAYGCHPYTSVFMR